MVSNIIYKRAQWSAKAESNHNSFRVLFDKIASVYFI